MTKTCIARTSQLLTRCLLTAAAILLAGCSALAPAPTPTATPSPPSTPTPPPTATRVVPMPSALATPSPMERAGAGTSDAGSEWEGIPVIPGAMDGSTAGFSYTYAVDMQIDEAEAFYRTQMEAHGWQLAERQASDQSMFGGPMVILDFKGDADSVNIMLIFSAAQHYTMVALTKHSP